MRERLWRLAIEKSYDGHLSLLRAWRKRPRDDGSAEQRNELAPFHWQYLPCFRAKG
jgi:hypothetical protein